MIRPDESICLSSELSDLQEIFEDMALDGWPQEIKGQVTLAKEAGGGWRVRGEDGGFAAWGKGGWRVLHECPTCGDEWWEDETPPSRCCLNWHKVEYGE